MQFLIAGAGAIGSHYGSLLQQAGFDVHLLARGAHLKALRAGGLRHETVGQTIDLELPAGDDPQLALDADVIIFCCKTTGLSAICEQLQPYVPPEAVLVTLQNGVTAPQVVQEWFPDHILIAGSAFIGARLEAPGHVIHSAAGHLRLGQWHGDGGEALMRVVEAFREAGVDCQTVDDPRRLLWHKMLWNCGFNAVTALTRRHARDIARDPATTQIVREAMEEALAVGVALGVALEERDVDRQLEVSRELGLVKTSMWQDIEAGKPTEIEVMNGYVTAQAAMLGMQAPVNRLLTTLIRALERR